MERGNPVSNEFIKYGKLTDHEMYNVLRELNRYKKNARVAGLYSSKEGKHVDKLSRNAKACWATTTIAPYSFNYLQSHAIEQYSQYPLDTTDIAEIQYTSYSVGGIFTWHRDDIVNHRQDKKTRGLTMSVNLSDPSTYTGGDLLVKSKCGEVALDKQKGSYIIFPSFFSHQACKVESGVREALVIWTYFTIEEVRWLKTQCAK